ncbi:hypothetical protein ABTX81_27115 [Kitasatospora sp. NPDC097605]|uniref:hypothetical protein n=1 Tax=Kitasatospora sp. NPDC097605 TaxID=3157226 RepID=UPI00332ECB60
MSSSLTAQPTFCRRATVEGSHCGSPVSLAISSASARTPGAFWAPSRTDSV